MIRLVEAVYDVNLNVVDWDCQFDIAYFDSGSQIAERILESLNQKSNDLYGADRYALLSGD
jgi:hypothetical protein